MYQVGQYVMYTVHFTFNGQALAPPVTIPGMVTAVSGHAITVRLLMNGGTTITCQYSDPNLRPA